MEQEFLYMDSFLLYMLQDNAYLFLNPANAYYAPPIAISMSSTTTRTMPSPDLAGSGASHLRSQISIDLDSGSGSTPTGSGSGSGNGGGAGSPHIRQTPYSPSLPSPPSISNNRLHSIITTQRPRRTHSHPSPNTQTPPLGRATNTPSSGENGPSEPFQDRDQMLENPLLSPEIETEDHILDDFVNGEFSSPSSYAPFTNTDSRPSQSHSVSQYSTLQASTPHRAFANNTVTTNTLTAAPRDPSSSTNCIFNVIGPERTTTQLSSVSNTTGESQSSLPIFDSLEDNDLFFDSPASSFSDAMPPTTRRTTTAAAARSGSTHTSKRRRTSTTAAPTAPTRPTSRQKRTPVLNKGMDVEELFDPSPTRSPIDLEAKPEFDTIDLTETNEVLENVRKLKKDDRIKLAAFQCVICMDDCSNLTVTHCGHLYCASCLHQSLHVDATKGKCPMCRQKLDMKPRESYNSKTKGYWPLELKLMTATRKGKRKANTLS